MRKYAQNNMVKNKRYLTTKQASQYLNLHIRTMQSLSRQGKIKCFRIGKRWMYLREDVEKYGTIYDGNKEGSSFMTANQVNAYLCIPLSTIYRLTKQYKIKAFKIGGSWRYPREDIEKYWLNNTNFSKEPGRKLDNLTGRRACPRINCSIPCYIHVDIPKKKNIIGHSTILNISEGGVFIEDVERKEELLNIRPDDPINIKFELDENINLEANGRVLRTQDKGIAVKFRNIPDNINNKIAKYIG